MVHALDASRETGEGELFSIFDGVEVDLVGPGVERQLVAEDVDDLLGHVERFGDRPDVQRRLPSPKPEALDQRGKATNVVDVGMCDEEIADRVGADLGALQRTPDVAAAVD